PVVVSAGLQARSSLSVSSATHLYPPKNREYATGLNRRKNPSLCQSRHRARGAAGFPSDLSFAASLGFLGFYRATGPVIYCGASASSGVPEHTPILRHNVRARTPDATRFKHRIPLLA